MNIFKKLTSAFLITAMLFTQFPSDAKAYVGQLPEISDMSQAIANGDLRGVVNFVESVKQTFALNPGEKYIVNFNFLDASGQSPLTLAASYGRDEIVQYLLSEGADPNFRNAYGETAVQAASNAGYLTTVNIFNPQPVVVQTTEVAEAEERINSRAGNNIDSWSTPQTVIYGATIGLVAAGGAALAFSGGGGGGGSGGGGGASIVNGLAVDCGAGFGSHPENCDPADLLTAEALAMEGIEGMNAQYSLARGYDGRIYNRDGAGALVDEVATGFVKVAVIDSGVDLDHPELDGNILADLAVNCTIINGCVAGGQDLDGHGTAVASIIAGERNETAGMHGVAPLAKLIPINMLGIAGGSAALSFKHANDNSAQVINNSWGYVKSSNSKDIPIVTTVNPFDNDPFTPAELRGLLVQSEGGTNLLAQLQRAVADSRIVVWAAGNSSMSEVGVENGLPYYFQGDMDGDPDKPVGYDTVNPEKYDWSQNWVSVVSLQDNLTSLSVFSNQCGIAKEWCIAAPGELATMADIGGGYAAGQGTSFAAPNVSGAIAAMLGAFPHLDPEEVLAIIFDTADDLGVAGVDDVYGHGLLNLQKASDPSDGGWTLSAFGGSNFSFGASGLMANPVFGNAFNAGNLNIMFRDKYNKDYTIPLSVLAKSNYQREDSRLKLARLGSGEFSGKLLLGENSSINYSLKDKYQRNDMLNYHAEGSEVNADVRNLLFTTKTGNEDASNEFSFGYNMNMAKAHTTAALSEVREGDLSVTKAFENPYLGFAKSAKTTVTSYDNKNMGLAFGVYDGVQEDEYSYQYKTDSGIRGMFAEYTVKQDDAKISFTAGTNIEDNTFLGSEVSGAFGMDGKALTNYAGIAAKYDVSDDLALVGSYNIGVTNLSMSKNSLVTDMSNIVTDSFSLGAEYSNFANTGGRFGVNISQPLRVVSGDANATLPVDIAANGSVLFNTRKISLAPTARQVDFETYYGLDISDKSKMAFSGVISTNPGNMAEAEDEGLLLMKLTHEF